MNNIVKRSEDLYKAKTEQLKKIYPALFSDEGNLNEEELRAFLKQFASTSEGKYEFNWAGKMSAKRNAFTTSRAMLKPDKDRSIDFDNTENLIIEGDNLEVLKLLQKSYQGKIKCIYIDPPYNTGKDFIYTDNFSEDKKAYWEKSGTTQDGVKLDTNTESQGRYHSNWLNMIYPRLLLGRNLLNEEGVIIISIDDNEIHNLRKVMDEMFGEENFVGTVIWHKKYAASNDAKYISNVHDYLVIYAKNKPELRLNLFPRSSELNAKYTNQDNDPRGDWSATNLSVKTYSEKNDYIITSPSGNKFSPPPSRCWVVSKEKLEELIKDNRIWFGKKGDSRPYLKTFLSEVQNGVVPTTVWSYEFAGHNIGAKSQIREIFKESNDLFDTPKPSKLIYKIIELIFGTEKPNGIILDFFAGSGTTAQAVMDFNLSNEANLRFILVQIPEKLTKKIKVTDKTLSTISDICIERVKRVSNKLKEEQTEGDLGFKVFALSPSYFPENLFTPDPEKTEEENKKALAKYIEEASTQLEFKFDEFDLMYEVLLKDGFTLNFKIEKLSEFTKNNIYKVTDREKHAYVTLDGDLKDETLQKLQSYTEERFICLERAVDTTKKWNLQNMFGSNLWVI